MYLHRVFSTAWLMGRGGHEEADDDPAVTSPLLIYPDFPLDVSGFFPGKHLPIFS